MAITKFYPLALIVVVFGCHKKDHGRSQLTCPDLAKDTVSIYLGRSFDEDKVSIKVNNVEYFSEVVTTDPSIEIATVERIPTDTIRNLTFIINDTDSLTLCPAPFLIINYLNGKIETESFDSLSRFRFE